MSERPPDAENWALPRSSIGGLSWPPLPPAEAIRLLALGHQLDESQWWPPDRLRAHQLRQLNALIAHAAGLPFYRERLEAAGIRSGAPASWESFARLRLLTRREVQTDGARMRTDRYPRTHGDVVRVRTTGATAMPASFELTAVSVAIAEAFALRGHEWRGERPAGKLALIMSLPAADGSEPISQKASHWGRPVAPVYPTGPAVLLGIGVETARQVEWLQRAEPELLITPASNLLALALHCSAHRARIPSLRFLRSVGETVTEEIRAACQDAWSLEPAADYAAKEAGVIALQCPEGRHYHVQSEAMIVEVLDDAGRPCAPGEVGRVVVTPLHSFAMPLLRYAIGDCAEVGTTCVCGRGLPVLARIQGRARDLLTLPSGERRFSLQASRVLRDIPGVRRFQIVQHRPGRIEIRLDIEPAFARASEARMRAAIVERVGGDFEIEFAYGKAIERSNDGLFREFVLARS
jgi:phenylacetate-CoA ligase